MSNGELDVQVRVKIKEAECKEDRPQRLELLQMKSVGLR